MDSSLQPDILRFWLLQTLGLIDLHPAVGFAPAVVGLIGDAELFAHFGYGFALPQQNIGFSQLVNVACPAIIGPVAMLGVLNIGGTDERQAI